VAGRGVLLKIDVWEPDPQPAWNTRGANSFLRGDQIFILHPIILNYVQHMFPGGRKILWEPSPGYRPGGNAVPTPDIKED